jgi:hypothetical protein
VQRRSGLWKLDDHNVNRRIAVTADVTPLETCWLGNDIRRFKEFDALLASCLSDNVIRFGICQSSLRDGRMMGAE